MAVTPDAVPTTLLLPSVVDAVGDQVAVIGAGGFSSGRGLVAALAYGASGIAMGTRFLLSRESTVPDNVKQIYLATAVTGTVVTTRVDGAPQRVIRTRLVDHLEGAGRLGALPRALRNALAFRRQTRTSMRALAREGLAMKEGNELSWAQVVMAANAPMMTKPPWSTVTPTSACSRPARWWASSRSCPRWPRSSAASSPRPTPPWPASARADRSPGSPSGLGHGHRCRRR